MSGKDEQLTSSDPFVVETSLSSEGVTRLVLADTPWSANTREVPDWVAKIRKRNKADDKETLIPVFVQEHVYKTVDEIVENADLSQINGIELLKNLKPIYWPAEKTSWSTYKTNHLRDAPKATEASIKPDREHPPFHPAKGSINENICDLLAICACLAADDVTIARGFFIENSNIEDLEKTFTKVMGRTFTDEEKSGIYNSLQGLFFKSKIDLIRKIVEKDSDKESLFYLAAAEWLDEFSNIFQGIESKEFRDNPPIAVRSSEMDDIDLESLTRISAVNAYYYAKVPTRLKEGEYFLISSLSIPKIKMQNTAIEIFSRELKPLGIDIPDFFESREIEERYRYTVLRDQLIKRTLENPPQDPDEKTKRILELCRQFEEHHFYVGILEQLEEHYKAHQHMWHKQETSTDEEKHDPSIVSFTDFIEKVRASGGRAATRGVINRLYRMDDSGFRK